MKSPLKLVAALALVLSACNNRPHIGGGDGGGGGSAGTISGIAITGRMKGSTVHVFRLDGATRGAEVTTATTGDDGAWSLNVGASQGPFLLVASGGSFVDEASGASINVGGDELTALLPSFAQGTSLSNVLITPVSHMAATLALHYVAAEGQKVTSASTEAWQHLKAHFGGLDWEKTVPQNFGVAAGNQLDDGAKAGLVIAALSQEATSISTTAGLTPGGAVNGLAITRALAQDLQADGFFDGVGPGGQLVLPADGASGSGAVTRLNSQAVRLFLAVSASKFLQSDKNATSMKVIDAQSFLDSMSRDSDSRLFRSGGGSFDTDPPVVSIVDASDKFQRESSVTLAATVDDGASGSGVKAAYALAVGDTPVAGTFDSSTSLWTFKDVPLAQGKNVVTVWGEDKANNSGRSWSAPYKDGVRVFMDSVAPVPAFDSTVTSYFDERSVGLAVSNGVPLVPAQYVFPAGTMKAVVDGSHPVFKVSTRLSWGAASPTAAVLEGDNPANTPFLRIAIPYSADAEAPITLVTYTAATTCPACGAALTDTGTLLRSSLVDSARVFFDLPITAETVTALTKLSSSPASIQFTLHASDAAGNQATFTGVPTIFFNVLGPPLSSQEDSSYASTSDARAVQHFKVNDGTYAALWSGDNGGEIARALRYRLFNPYPVDLPIDISASGGWTVREKWDRWTGTLASTVYSGSPTQEIRPSDSWAVNSECPNYTHNYPCVFGSYATFRQGSTQCQAFAPEAGDGTLLDHSNGSVVRSAWLGSNESTAATAFGTSSGTKFVLPAATNNNPGQLLVYVGRAFVGSHVPSLQYSAPPNVTSGSAGFYNFQYYFLTNPTEVLTYACPGGSPGQYDASNFTSAALFQKLGGAEEQYTGTLTVRAFAPGTSASTTLESPGPDLSAAFNRTLSH